MNPYPNGPQQPYQQQPSNPGYPPQGQPGPYQQQPGYPPSGYPQGQPPYPQQQPMQPPVQQQQPKKKPGIFKIGCGVLAAVIILIVVIAVANGGKSNTGTAVTTSTTSSTTNSTNAQHFKVGDTVKVGTDWQAVVNSAKTDSGGQYSALKSGDVYLVVDISLTNLSSQEQTVSSLIDFTLQDSTGQKYNESIDPNAGASLDGKVAAGSPLRGVIAFEVPSAQKSYQLHYSPDIVSSGQTTWDLSV